jgi:hypothetical protein
MLHRYRNATRQGFAEEQRFMQTYRGGTTPDIEENLMDQSYRITGAPGVWEMDRKTLEIEDDTVWVVNADGVRMLVYYSMLLPVISVDELAAIIREVDGNHDLGTGALAEAILERLRDLS